MEYNTKIIDYGDYLHIQYYDRTLSRVDFPDYIQKQFDQDEKDTIINDLKVDSEEKQVHNIKTSLNRSKNNLYRIARSNEWDLFITITFDQKLTDSSNFEEVSKKITTFLNNLRKRGSPDLKYLIVPELHKDKQHYHFHGLISNAPSLDLVDSGHVDKAGDIIYNIYNWKIGFTTAMKIKSQAAVRNYIGKYITKDLMQKLKYKKRYFASKNVYICPEEYKMLHLEDIYDQYADNISFAKTVTINGIQRIKYFEVKKV